jgi:enoyl-CoA hydratase/carnithine racemase
MVDYAYMKRNTDDFMSLWRCPKPTIAKVHGAAVAGGSDIALCCDLLVMADDARIGYMPTRVWGCPTTAMWTYRLGPTRAKQMMFTGDVIDGRTAADWGLANLAVPAAELDAATLQAGRAHRRRAARPAGDAQDGGQPGAAEHGAGTVAAAGHGVRRHHPPQPRRACGSAVMRRTTASRPRCSGATAASPSPKATRRVQRIAELQAWMALAISSMSKMALCSSVICCKASAVGWSTA